MTFSLAQVCFEPASHLRTGRGGEAIPSTPQAEAQTDAEVPAQNGDPLVPASRIPLDRKRLRLII